MGVQNRNIPPSGDYTDPNFVNNINSVNKELGFHTTRQPCKEYLLARKLEKRGYNMTELDQMNLDELTDLWEHGGIKIF